MDFSLSEDQLALREAVRRWCEDNYPAQHRGNTESADALQAHWQGLADLGLLGIAVDPEHDGAGMGAAEMMLVTHEMGRVLGGSGFVPSAVLASNLLAHSDAVLQQRWLPALVQGKAVLSYAASPQEMANDFSHAGVVATSLAASFILDGEKAFVLECAQPDLLLLLARTSGSEGDTSGLTLFAVDAVTAGVKLTPYTMLDGRRAAQLKLQQVQVPASAVVGQVGKGYELAQLAVDRALAAWCSEAVGAIEGLFDLTLEYVKTRRQFGAPLAKFQVVQHRLADVLMSLELCRSLACAAAMAVDEAQPEERRRIVMSSKVFIGRAGREAGHCAVQLHGGMGMTDECRVGHYVKRLAVLDQYFGNASLQLSQLAA